MILFIIILKNCKLANCPLQFFFSIRSLVFLPTKRPSAELDLALHEICYATVHDSTNWEKSQAGLVKAWSLFASTLLETMICKNTLNILLCKTKTCVALMLVRLLIHVLGLTRCSAPVNSVIWRLRSGSRDL